MKLILPKGYNIHATELDDGRWKLHYEEIYEATELDQIRLQGTMTVLESKLGAIIDYNTDANEGKIIIDVIGERSMVLNTIAGEFLSVSSLGQAKLCELMALFALVGLGTVEDTKE
jgi:hypothetical protein